MYYLVGRFGKYGKKAFFGVVNFNGIRRRRAETIANEKGVYFLRLFLDGLCKSPGFLLVGLGDVIIAWVIFSTLLNSPYMFPRRFTSFCFADSMAFFGV